MRTTNTRIVHIDRLGAEGHDDLQGLKDKRGPASAMAHGGNLYQSLRGLQRRQFAHDVAAHQDIALSLSVPKRLKHFTLHFAKYLGALHKAERLSDIEARDRAIADTFIIALAAANALHVDLQNRIVSDAAATIDPTPGLLPSFAEVIGDMAKACEAMDHLEAFPSREILERSVVALVYLIVEYSGDKRIDLTRAVESRWAKAESKSFLTEIASSIAQASDPS